MRYNDYTCFILVLTNSLCIAFKSSHTLLSCRYHSQLGLTVKPEDTNIPSPVSKLLFTIAEGFGSLLTSSLRLIETNDTNKLASVTQNVNSFSTKNIAQSIRTEYENIFWVTGNMDTSLWASDCTFADPFSSFSGSGSTIRFKRNADNLGNLVLNPVNKITSFEITQLDEPTRSTLDRYLSSSYISSLNEQDVEIVKVGWSFSGKLNFPWKPILAAAGVTNHFIRRDTGKIFLYQEVWKSKPVDVVKRLFVPTR